MSGADNVWFDAWAKLLPLGERWWLTESKRREGKPVEIRTATTADVRKLKQTMSKHPDHVARRGVLTFDAFPIWAYAHLDKISWFKVTWEQDRELDA